MVLYILMVKFYAVATRGKIHQPIWRDVLLQGYSAKQTIYIDKKE